MSSAPDLTARILRHERALVTGSVAILAALCWFYLATRPGMDEGMAGMAEPPFSALVVMWWLMMAAMMLPSATPAVLLYARVREMRSRDAAIAQTWVFLAGYLGVWLVFSVTAAFAQHLFTDRSMALDNRLAQGAVLTAAGLYQLSPLKSACLRQCRTPAEFISRHWRAGWRGAMRLGGLHGLYCLGCCWMLMAVLFVGGVMNLLWVVGLAIIVAIEKLVPHGQLFGRAIGAALVACGILRITGF